MLDIIFMLTIIGGFIVIGGGIAFLVLFYDDLEFMPRKYYKVYINHMVAEDGNLPRPKRVRSVKGWFINRKKVPHFRIGLGFLKGADLDKGLEQLMDQNGEIDLMEKVDGLKEPQNFLPMNVPVTRKEEFINKMCGTINFGENVEAVKATMRKYLDECSNYDDIKGSNWVSGHVLQINQQAQRTKKDDVLMLVALPLLAIVGAGLFAYLMIDSANKESAKAAESISIGCYSTCAEMIRTCGGTPPNFTRGVQNNTIPNPLPLQITK